MASYTWRNIIEERWEPSPTSTLPDYMLFNHENTLIAIHGLATWESLSYLLLSLTKLLESTGKLTQEIRNHSESSNDSSLRREVSVLDSVLAELEVEVNALSIKTLPDAIRLLDDIFVPAARLADLRHFLIVAVQSLATVGEALEEFIAQGFKKKVTEGFLLWKSRRLFSKDTPKLLRDTGKQALHKFAEQIIDLVNFCDQGGRFNIGPNGEVRYGFGVSSGQPGEQDPQVALDNVFKDTDRWDGYWDFYDISGLGPRRRLEDTPGSLVIRARNGQAFIF